VDRDRFGRGIRALRKRRRLTQADLGARIGWSRSKVSRIESGRLEGVGFDDLEDLASALDARVQLDLAWRGAAIDRLIDERHTALVDSTVRWLIGLGWDVLVWDVLVEASFSIFGERGSIDVFGRHPTGALLVVEVKASVGDANQTLIGIDRKVRLAPRIARDRGWPAGAVGALLVIADTTTSRRRIGLHGATFRASLPTSAAACRRWVASPVGRPERGIVFVALPHSHRASRSRA
jgi:transcriptional regulator with XRE-family HTH domain